MRIFHLSDLHLRDGWPEEQGVVIGSLSTELKDKVKENDYLVFSGDLVHGGANEKHYDEFRKKFAPVLNLFQKQNRICVPGNHDIDRTYLEENISVFEGLRSTIPDETGFNNVISGSLSDIVSKKFEKFFKFSNDIFGINLDKDNYCGKGIDIGNGVGIYILNTSLYSFGGAKSSLTGDSIDDERKLPVNTRNLTTWLQSNEFDSRILIMHHPIEWLVPWAQKELGIIIRNQFDFALCGHTHEMKQVSLIGTGAGKPILVAPPLFERKRSQNGYTVVTWEKVNKNLKLVAYGWSSTTHQFVLGTSLVGNDTAEIEINVGASMPPASPALQPVSPGPDTVERKLRARFENSLRNYGHGSNNWIPPRVSEFPENQSTPEEAEFVNLSNFISGHDLIVIKAPPRFGLTTLGYKLVVDEWLKAKKIPFCDLADLPNYSTGLEKKLGLVCAAEFDGDNSFDGIILDVRPDDRSKLERFIPAFQSTFPKKKLIILYSYRSLNEFSTSQIEIDLDGAKIFYIWSLNRSDIRSLVRSYIDNGLNWDENRLTDVVSNSLINSNVHRTPLQVISIIRAAEIQPDLSPVNQAELHLFQLQAAFLRHSPAAGHDRTPDVRDCCYALGALCAELVRSREIEFTESKFFLVLADYCESKSVDIELSVLLEILKSERIIVLSPKGLRFQYTFWVYYFTAYRMLAEEKYREEILGSKLHIRYPEIVDYYSGIDRKRDDLIELLNSELGMMNGAFVSRTEIPEDFSVHEKIKWLSNEKQVDDWLEETQQAAKESSLPTVVKDELTERSVDRTRPYRQELRRYVEDLSLGLSRMAMVAAARSLRNSDHVDTDGKLRLLRQVFVHWKQMAQVITVLSPIIAKDRSALFEGILFFVGKSWDDKNSDDDPNLDVVAERAIGISMLSLGSVAHVYGNEMRSRRMGPLLYKFLVEEKDETLRYFCAQQIIGIKPKGWVGNIEKYIWEIGKNSFFLRCIYNQCRHEERFGFISETELSGLKHLIAIIVAKHSAGAKRPSKKMIEKAKSLLSKRDK